MTIRTISVLLTARVSNYINEMQRAEASTKKVGEAMVAGGALAAAGLAVVIAKSAEYGSKMAQLQSLSKASAADMKRLSAAAMEQGKAYGYSASQVADAEIELTKAGFNTSQILGGGLKSALSLAAAGQLDVSEATGITTIALTQFQLQAKDLPHVADMLAAGADKALGSVSDLGQGLSNGGSSAAAMGISLQDTIGALSAFANAGTIGAEGGTQLKSMLMALQNQTPKAKKALDELGISVYDQQGKFVGLSNLAGQLSDKLGKKSIAERNAATATIFGSYAQAAANVLIREGAEGMAGWTAKVNEYGFANVQAAGKMNSLSGDVQKLAAAFDTSLIKAGSGANEVLRGIVQTGTNLTDVVGSIPGPVLSVGVALTAGAAAVGLLGGGLLLAIPRVIAFRTAMTSLGVSGRRVGAAFGKGSAALIGVAALGAGLSNLNVEGSANAQQLALAADQLGNKWKNVDSNFKSAGVLSFASGTRGAAAALQELEGNLSINSHLASFWDNLTGITGAGTHFADVYKSNAQTLDAYGQQLGGLAAQDLPAAQRSFRELNKHFGGTAESAKQAVTRMTPYRDALAEIAQKAGVTASTQNLVNIAQGRGGASAKVLAHQAKEAAAAAKEQSAALSALAGAADHGATSVDALKTAIDGLDGGQLSARDAARQLEQAIDDASAAAKKNGRSLDISTQAGRDNQAALDGIASAAKASAAAHLEAGGNAEGASKIIRSSKKAYVDAAVSMGLSRAAALKLADSILAIPRAPRITVRIDDVDAKKRIRDTAIALAALDGQIAKVYIQAVNQSKVPTSVSASLIASGRAEGGAIDGPGPKGRDSVPAVLAPGEHVLTAGDVDAMGGQANVYRFRDALHMAKGGAVGKGKSVLTRGQAELTAALTKRKKLAGRSAIADATAAAASAQSDADRLKRQITAAKKKAAADEKAAEKAQKAYDDIDGTKKNRAKKKAAKARADAAKKKADAADKRVETLQGDRDDAIQARDKANESAKQLRFNREDFVSSERRGVTDPLSYVDQLRSMSRDDNFSPAKQKKFAAAANQYEKSLVDLAKKSEKAAEKLADLRESSKQLASSVSSAITGRYGIANASSVQQTSGWTVRDGIKFQTTSSSISAASIDSYYGKGATDTETFARQLDQLRKRGVNGQLLAEIAQDANGPALATAMLSGSGQQIASINSGYGRIQNAAGTAGQTVADANYAALIVSAQRDTDRITKQLSEDSEKLRKLIASAFGLSGYAVGTSAATPGLHMVGEQGPELVTGPSVRRFGGGERVYTYGQTQAYLRGTGQAGSGRGGAASISVSGPESLTLVDADGMLMGTFKVAARSVARQEIHSNAAQGAVAWVGGAV